MGWEGELVWELDRDDERGDLSGVIHTQVKVRFEFCGIVPDKA